MCSAFERKTRVLPKLAVALAEHGVVWVNSTSAGVIEIKCWTCAQTGIGLTTISGEFDQCLCGNRAASEANLSDVERRVECRM